MEFHISVLSDFIFTREGFHGKNIIVFGAVDFVDHTAAAEVTFEDGVYGGEEGVDEGSAVLQEGGELGLHRLEVGAVAAHTLFVGAGADAHAGPDKCGSVLAFEVDGLAHFEDRIGVGEIILDQDIHTADGIVQDRDGVDVEGHIKVQVDPVEKMGNGGDGTLVALGGDIAITVGQTELQGIGAGILAQDAEDLDLRHGVALKLEAADRVVFLIQNGQEHEVALATVAVAVVGRGFRLVVADQKDRGQALTLRVSLAGDGDGLAVVVVFRQLAALFRLVFLRAQDDHGGDEQRDAEKDKKHSHLEGGLLLHGGHLRFRGNRYKLSNCIITYFFEMATS